MSGFRISRKVVWVTVLCFVVAGVSLLSLVPLARVPNKDSIGKLDLDKEGATLQVSLLPPKRLNSITICLSQPVKGSDDHCHAPDFQLSIRIKITDKSGMVFVDELIKEEQMQWTNWHDSPSLLVMSGATLKNLLDSESEYEFAITVDSATSDIGKADIYLHWFDGGYLWGSDKHSLRLINQSSSNQ